MSVPRIVTARLSAVAKIVQHPLGAAIVLKTGDVVVIEPGLARLAADMAAADRRPGDTVEDALAEGERVGTL